MVNYKHTQIGYPLIIILGILVLVIGLTMFSEPIAEGFFFQVLAIITLIACLVIFSSLTIEVKKTRVVAQFGLGIIRKAIPITEIVSCEIIRIPWYHGIGIRWIPGSGWMFNVSTGKAVKIIRKDKKPFFLGTSDPKNLCQAIQSRLEQKESM